MSENIHHGTERFEGQSKQVLESILSRSVMPHTIDTFYTSAMQALCALADRATTEYKRAHPDTTLTGSALEDVALGYKFGDLLTEIGKREELVKSIQAHVSEKIKNNTIVYVPPQQGIMLTPGSGRGLESRSVIPRVTGLLYSVHNDLGIDYNDAELVRVERGMVHDDMMRNEPYYSIEIPDLKRLVLVCEEEGNATYVFDTTQLRKLGISIAHLKLQNKLYFRSLNELHPDTVVSIRYSENWRERMLQVLSEPFETRINEKTDKQSKKTKSDFTPRIEFSKKKDGWENKSFFSKHEKLGHWDTIVAYVEAYRDSHPEWFEVQNSGTKNAEYYHPELVAKIREHFLPTSKLRQLAPLKREGWACASALEKLKGFPQKKRIKKFVDQFRNAHPEWFEVQNSWRKNAEHYHPELVKRIREHFASQLELLESMPPKKDGWGSANFLRSILGTNDLAIKDFANTFRTEHPEWFEMQLSKAGSAAEHYHPELVARLQEHFIPLRKLREDAPLKRYGWETRGSLSSEGYSNVEPIKNFVAQFRTAHPEWFEAQNVSGNVVEHYHPELVAKIREHFLPTLKLRQNTPLKRDGWKSASILEKLGDFPRNQTIKRFVEQFRDTNPEWFEMQLPKKGSVAEHYHPELVKRIREHFASQLELLESMPPKKDGWESSSFLQRSLRKKIDRIVDFAHTFRAEHPEWFEMQVSKAGSGVEHYHPELVEKIRSHFS